MLRHAQETAADAGRTENLQPDDPTFCVQVHPEPEEAGERDGPRNGEAGEGEDHPPAATGGAEEGDGERVQRDRFVQFVAGNSTDERHDVGDQLARLAVQGGQN